MKKLLVLENHKALKPDGFDHVFSFDGEAGDLFPDEYLDGHEDLRIYDEIYAALFGYLEQRKRKHQLVYRGVDLLWCFKKIVFESTYRTCLRYLVGKALLERFPAYELYLEKEQKKPSDPYLSRIFEFSPLKKADRVKIWTEDFYNAAASKVSISEVVRSWKRFWPARILKGEVSSGRVAVLGDYGKVRSVINALKGSHPIYFSSERSPRMFSLAIQNKFSFYQAAPNETSLRSYRTDAQRFKRKLHEYHELSVLKVRDLAVGPLIMDYLADLFDTHLPKLLFDIDQIHTFFERARSLRSVLCDEDSTLFSCAFCQISNLFQVKSYVECHGSLGHKSGYLPLTASTIFVWGNAQRKKLIEWGCDPARIVVSGCSRYRSYDEMSLREARRRAARALRISGSKKWILIAFTPAKAYGRVFKRRLNRIIDETLSLTAEFPEAQFILKIHPGDRNRNYFSEAIKKNRLSHAVRMIEHFDSLLLAKAVDVLVIYRSTYAIDGFALRKPVICLYDEGVCNLLDEYKRFGIFRDVVGKAALGQALRAALNETQPIGDWQAARSECLNDCGVIAEQLISTFLMNNHQDDKTVNHIQKEVEASI